ncbi:MAG: DUF4922 domain-containing protein [Bacteroidales bacterium]
MDHHIETIDNFRLEELFKSQISCWDLAAQNYRILQSADMRTLPVGGITVELQHNGGRINSVAANITSVQKGSGCILCLVNRPEEQLRIGFGGRYEVLVNPYPVFNRHFTIVSNVHTPQAIEGRLTDMLLFARNASGYVTFYNGAGCGASVPGHLHFQAGEKGILPLERDWCVLKRLYGREIFSADGLSVMNLTGCSTKPVVFECCDPDIIIRAVMNFIHIIPQKEVMVNIVVSYDNGKYLIWVYPRRAHRPLCYYREGDDKRLISPGAIEMSGLFILPRICDYENVSASEISEIFEEISLLDEDMEIICTKWVETIS